MFSFRITARVLHHRRPQTASSACESLACRFRIPSSSPPPSPSSPSQRQQRRTYLLLSTTLNSKTVPQPPANLPGPPKSIILLVSPPSAASLSVQALSPLTNDLTASVLAAVVDSVPGSSAGPTGAHDGVRASAYSWLVTDHTLPIRHATQAQPTSLTFTLPSARFTIPLANTLFENGQPATAVHLPSMHQRALVEAATNLSPAEVEEFAQAQADVKEAWQELGELMTVVGARHGLHTPAPAASIEITVPAEVLREGRGARIHSRLPLRALTPPRQIEEGMGNILRQLATPPSAAGTQSRGGASRELEAAVSAYMQSLPAGQAGAGAVQVFARLTPQQPAATSPAELLLYPGARLHRVLSGGGGWGNKAGLLALDPQAERDVAGFERELAARLDGDDGPHGGIVQPGAWAQFFVVEPAAAAAAAADRGIQFGAVAKAQHMASPATDHRGAMGGAEEGEEKTLEGVFGGASELGVDVSVAGKTRRMDVPGGVVIIDA